MGFWEGLRITFLAQRSDLAVLDAERGRRDARGSDPAAGLTVRGQSTSGLC